MVVRRNGPRDLPDDLALPLESGAPWWYWLGARPSVDLVNTRRERWRRSVETLVTPDDLAQALVAAGLDGHLPDRLSEATEAMSEVDIRFREAEERYEEERADAGETEPEPSSASARTSETPEAWF